MFKNQFKIFQVMITLFCFVVQNTAYAWANQSLLMRSGYEVSVYKTYGDYWKNQATQFKDDPALLELQKVIQQNSQKDFPQVQFKNVLDQQGQKNIELLITSQGKTFSVTYNPLSPDRLRFAGLLLSRSDLSHIASIVSRLSQGVPSIQESLLQTGQLSQNDFLIEYPILTKENYKKMSKTDRAQYIVFLKQLYRDAIMVNESSQKKLDKSSIQPKKTAEYLYEILFGSLAEAAQDYKKESSEKILSGQHCVVAGFVTKYTFEGDKKTCRIQSALQDKFDDSEIQASKKFCAQKNLVPCNVYVHGYDQQGDPICISDKDSSFQKASHWMGVCDRVNKLTATQVNSDNFKDDSKLLTELEKRQTRIDSGIYAGASLETKNFIESVLKHKKDGSDSQLLQDFLDGKYSEKLISELNRIRDVFQKEISFAQNNCAEQLSQPNKIKLADEFLGACRQLRARALFVQPFIDQLEKYNQPHQVVKSEPIGDSKNQLDRVEVSGKARSCEDIYPGSGAQKKEIDGSVECVCANGKEPQKNNKLQKVQLDGFESKESYSCSENTNWWPLWILGGALVLHQLKNWLKTDNPVYLTCPDGRTKKVRLADCPQGVRCPAGNTVYAPLTCPIEGGSGQNCPQGNCNGGVPSVK